MELKNLPIEQMRSESKLFIISALIRLGEKIMQIDDSSSKSGENKKFFNFEPDNLTYDIHGTILCEDMREESEEEFYGLNKYVNEYKSLIGFVFQSRYSYYDYLNGGMALLKKNRYMKKIVSLENVQDIIVALEEIYIMIYEEQKKNIIEIKKKKYNTTKVLMIFGIIVSIVLGIFVFYYSYIVNPHNEIVIKVQNAYLSGDYRSCVDISNQADIEEFDILTKKIIATSVINDSSFTYVKKEKELENIENFNNEIVLNYWLMIGRNQYSEAENIAMQLSSDTLLLNAYVKERNYLIGNINIDGQEKSKRLDELQKEIKDITNM